jgi:hypothetical protein
MAAERSVAAQVFLKTPSGKSLRDADTSSLSGGLDDYRPDRAVRDKATHILGRLGFGVFEAADGLTLSIQAPASVFTSVFGVKADRLRRIRPTSTRDLDVPDELEPFVDAIVVLPPPEYFE